MGDANNEGGEGGSKKGMIVKILVALVIIAIVVSLGVWAYAAYQNKGKDDAGSGLKSYEESNLSPKDEKSEKSEKKKEGGDKKESKVKGSGLLQSDFLKPEVEVPDMTSA